MNVFGRPVAIVVGIAVSVRLFLVLYVLCHCGPAWFFSRGSEMGFLADSFLHGKGLASPFGVPTGPTAIVAPAYPLLVSGVFRVFGVYSKASALCLMLLNVACNTATVYLVYKLSRLVATKDPALVVTLFWALSLPLIWMPTICWETSLSALLLIGTVWSMLSVQKTRSAHFWLICGGACGGIGLLNPALLLSVMGLAGYTLFRTTAAPARRKRIAACVAGFLLVFSSWPIRNALIFHSCVLTRTTIGFELWMGNHPGASGFLEPSLFPTYNRAEIAAYEEQGEIAYTAHKSRLARTFIQAHPRTFILLSLRRISRFWTGSGTRPESLLFIVHAILSTFLGCSGLYLIWRDGQKILFHSFIIPLVLFPLPYYITHAEFRYRLLLDPTLTVLSARALAWLLIRTRAERTEDTADPMLRL